MAPHSSTLAWKIPWMEEPGRLQSMGSQRVGHDFTFTFTFHIRALEKEMATQSSVLAWTIQGRGSLVGCRLWGCTESDMNEATWRIGPILGWPKYSCGFFPKMLWKSPNKHFGQPTLSCHLPQHFFTTFSFNFFLPFQFLFFLFLSRISFKDAFLH